MSHWPSTKARQVLAALLLGGSIGLVVGIIWSICGLRANLPISKQIWFSINITGLTFTGITIGAVQRSPRLVGFIAGLAYFSLFTIIAVPADDRIVLWILCFGTSGGGLGIFIGWIFMLIKLMKWWIS